MTTNQHGEHSVSPTCNFTAVLHPQAPSTLCTTGGRDRRIPRDVQVECPSKCGYRTPMTTPALAQRGLQLHSCDRHRRKAQASARFTQRMGTVDRTPKPCSHKNTTHVHGTYACYSLDQCRCRPCVDAVTSYERTRTRQTAYGRWQPYVDASPARQHVEELRAAGMGLKLIARHSGVAHGALAKLIYGDAQRRLAPSKRIRPETERKILAVQATIDTLGATVHVDATGTRRRLQALVAVGWSQSQLARRLDMAVGNLGRTMTATAVRADTARRVRTLYDELSAKRPAPITRFEQAGVTRALNLAKNRGWLEPLWWDDDTIDDPAHHPARREQLTKHDIDPIAVDRACAGDRIRLTIAERHTAVARLTARGLNNAQIAELLHTTRDAIQQVQSRHLRHSLAVSS